MNMRKLCSKKLLILSYARPAAAFITLNTQNLLVLIVSLNFTCVPVLDVSMKATLPNKALMLPILILTIVVSVYGIEAAIPLTTYTYSPPEGNTTFLGGTSWCVAVPGASQADLQNALDWACGLGKVDCRPIQQGGPCFNPDTLLSHASYAFNYYYQQNGNSDVACNFGGTARLTNINPSYGKCIYSTSGSVSSDAAEKLKHRPLLQNIWVVFVCGLVLLLHILRC